MLVTINPTPPKAVQRKTFYPLILLAYSTYFVQNGLKRFEQSRYQLATNWQPENLNWQPIGNGVAENGQHY